MKTITSNDKGDMEEVIRACDICYVGMAGNDGLPYVLPMNFGYEEGWLYLHSGQKGHKIDLLGQNPRVCVTFCSEHKLVWQDPDMACSYSMHSKSVVAWGKVVFVEDAAQKNAALQVLMKHYTGRDDYQISAPAIRNVRVWKIFLEAGTCKVKEFGVSRKNA
jgi:nitroimidazol reductase NimA-like FMN-containing flavoprotein (pyridoxamine 5'-phosphate oxidase superfamily)